MTESLRAGQVASAAGVNLETLRYYERRGLIASPPRSLGGQRQYPVEVVTLLRVIKAAQRLGFSLDEIGELILAGVHRHLPQRDGALQSRIPVKIADLDQRIADLQVIRSSLVAAQSAGCDDLMTCAGTPQCPIPFPALQDGDRDPLLS